MTPEEAKALAIAKYKKIKEKPISETLIDGILRGGLAGGITGAALTSVPAAVCMVNHDAYKNQEFNKKDHLKCVALSALLGGAGGSLIGGTIGGISSLAKKEDAAYRLSKLMPKNAAAKDYLIGGLTGAGIGAGGGMLANMVLGKKLFSMPMIMAGAGIGGGAGLAVGHQQAKFRSGESASDYTARNMIRKDAQGRDIFYIRNGTEALQYGNDGFMYCIKRNEEGKPVDEEGKPLKEGDPVVMERYKAAYRDPTKNEQRLNPKTNKLEDADWGGGRPIGEKEEVRWDKDSKNLYILTQEGDKTVKKDILDPRRQYHQGIYIVAVREVPISEALGMKQNEALDNGIPGLKNIFTHAAAVAVKDHPFYVEVPGPDGKRLKKWARPDGNGQYVMEFGLTAWPDKRVGREGFKKLLEPKWTGPYTGGPKSCLVQDVPSDQNPDPQMHFENTKDDEEPIVEKEVLKNRDNPYGNSQNNYGWDYGVGKTMMRIANGIHTPAMQVMSLTDPSIDMDDELFTGIMGDWSDHLERNKEGYGRYNITTKPVSSFLVDGDPYRNCHEFLIGWLSHLTHKFPGRIPKKSQKWIAGSPFPALAGDFTRSTRGQKTFFPEDFEDGRSN